MWQRIVGRVVLVAALLCAHSDLRADVVDPRTYHVVQRWPGAVQQTDLGLLMVQATPAWQTSEPALVLMTQAGAPRYQALPGADVRAAVVHRGAVYAVVARSGSETDVLDVVVFGPTLTVRQRFELPVTLTSSADVVEMIGSEVSTSLYIRVGSTLVLYRSDRLPAITVLEQQLQSMCRVALPMGEVAYVHDVGGTAFLSVIDSMGVSRSAVQIPLAERSRLEPLPRGVAVFSGVDAERRTQVTLVDVAAQDVRLITVPAPRPWVDVVEVEGQVVIAAVVQRGGRTEVVVWEPTGSGEAPSDGVALDRDLGMPVRVSVVGSMVIVLSQAGIVTLSTDGQVYSRDDLFVGDLPATTLIREFGDAILVQSPSQSLTVGWSAQPWWWILRSLQGAWTAVVPLVLGSVILILYVRLRSQRRLFTSLVDVPAAGLVFVVDRAGRLVRTNERGASLVRLSKRVPMGRSFHSYVRHPGMEGIRSFLMEAYVRQRPISERVRVSDDDEQRDYMFTSMPIVGSVGRFRGLIVTAVDITEALEQRRLVNWAQLAHDMQTNLSTIRLNAEQLARETGADGNERLRRILFQTHVLTQRVRDLVSVGRTEDLQRESVHSSDLCHQIREEFDAEMFPHVTFVLKLRGAVMNVDRLKLSRAIRNAVENAIKALRGAPGTVEIATWADREAVYVGVTDTGVGMDTLTMEHMMKPYFTTSRDGTGTGIGTMIMQHVTQLHGGTLHVTSELGQGTHVVFRIPHQMQGARPHE